MSWFKVDDKLHSHPKVAGVSLEAMGLWLLCGSYCSDHLTNGFVPWPVLVRYAKGNARAKKLVRQLVASCLWAENETGIVFHDYLAHNPSRESVLQERKKTAQRVERYRASKRAGNGVCNAVTNGVANGVSNAAPVPDPDPVPVPDKQKSPLGPPLVLVTRATDDGDDAPAAAATKAGRIEAAHARYAAAYAAGVSSATGLPYASSRYDGVDLASLVLVHAKGLRGDALDEWLRRTAADYVQATRDNARFQNGFGVKKFAEWLNARGFADGKPAAPVTRKYKLLPMYDDDGNEIPVSEVRR